MHNFNKCLPFMHCAEFSQWLVFICSPLAGNQTQQKHVQYSDIYTHPIRAKKERFKKKFN